MLRLLVHQKLESAEVPSDTFGVVYWPLRSFACDIREVQKLQIKRHDNDVFDADFE